MIQDKSQNRFFSLKSALIYLFLFLPGISHADNNNSNRQKIILSWETPEEGSAVNFRSEKDYLNAPPVLRSDLAAPQITKLEIDTSPVLQKLIIPGAENSTDDDPAPEDEISDNKIGIRAARKAEEFYENKIKTVNINGSVLNIETDCSFFVRAAYWEGSNHTRDLFRDSLASKSIDPNKATGVTLLSSYFEKHHKYRSKNPRIGDIIIFDNTYDKNHNEKRDDYYTHTGIVTNIREDQTIEFIHGNIGRTIKKGYINFNYKDNSMIDNKSINSYIRPRYPWEKNTNLSLASYLVRAFAGY